MRPLIPFLVFIITLSYNVSAQSDYTPIQCKGIIPSEFIDLTTNKIERANEGYQGESQTQISKRQFKRYNSESNFYVDYLLKSGMIVFGTSMNDYVNRVGEYVLKSFPGIADDIRFYIVKSPSVNAFTNEQGIVFINIGLIAQLENEAQLAFIISHELIHYKYNHSFESYKEEMKAEYDYAEYGHLSIESKKSRLLQYSRKNEMTADSLGFLEGYYNTDYSFDEALNVFDVLLYSNLPFDEIEFDTTFFNDDNYTISSKCILKKVDLVSNPEEYDDHNLTHPNIKKRRNMMISIVTSMDNPNKAKFIVSKDDFMKLQKEARFEMSNLYLSNLQYDKAFYNSYLLLRKYPNSNYLKKTIAYCIYAISVQKKLGSIRGKIQSYKKVEGQSQRISYLFRKMKTKEASSLAVKLLWDYHREHQKDGFITKTLNAAIDILIAECNIHFSSIYPPKKAYVVPTSQDSIAPDSTLDFKKLSKKDYEELSKYDKIRYDKKYQLYFGTTSAKSKTIKFKNYLSVLSTESTDSGFKELYVNRQSNIENIASTSQVRNILLVNPQFYKLKNDFLMVQGTERLEIDFTKSIVKMGAKRNINISTLDILNIRASEVAEFNDLALLNAWIEEYGNLSDVEHMEYMIPWLSNYTASLRQKYNLRYVATSGLLEVDMTRSVGKRIGYVFKGLILWQASPYFFIEAASNDHVIYHFFYCIDMETNNTVINENTHAEAKASQDYVNSLNYNIMYQIKPKK